MKKTLILALFCALGWSGLAAADLSSTSQVEGALLNLRSADESVVLQTLEGLPAMKGYPDSAQPLLPALIWIKAADKEDISEEAGDRLEEMGWPKKYCLPCIRKFAARQDNVYKMMGISALVDIAWTDPEVMLLLLQISQGSKPEINAMVRAAAATLSRETCTMQDDMEAWNLKALPFLGPMQEVFATADWRVRPMAEAMLKCPRLRDDLKTAAQAFLERNPRSTTQQAIEDQQKQRDASHHDTP